MRNKNLLKQLGKTTLAILLSACMAAGTPGVAMAAESGGMETEGTTEGTEATQSESETSGQELQTEGATEESTESSTEDLTEEPESDLQTEENLNVMPLTEMTQTENEAAPGDAGRNGYSLQQPRSTETEDWEAVNKAGTIIENSVIEVKWEDIRSEHSYDEIKLEAFVKEKIKNLPGMAETGGVIDKVSNRYGDMMMPVVGTLDKPEGIDGKFNVDITIKAGTQIFYKNKNIIVKTISFTDPADYKDLQDAEKVKQIIEDSCLDMKQEDALTDAAFLSSLVKLLNNLPGMAEIGWEFKIEDLGNGPDHSFAREGTLENPKGINGDFGHYYLYIQRGKAYTSVPLYGDIIATPFEKTSDGKIYKQLQDAVSKINFTRFELGQGKAGTQDQAVTELFRMVNSLPELAGPGINLDMGSLATAINYSAAKQGTSSNPEGTDGYLWFWVKVPLGKYENNALISSVIRAERYVEAEKPDESEKPEESEKPVDSKDREAVDKVKEILDNKIFTIAQSAALTKDAAVNELFAQLNSQEGIKQTGIKLTVENIYSCPDFRLAQAGTEANPEGTDGGCNMTLYITKGLANTTAQITMIITAEKLNGQWKRNTKGWWYEYKGGAYPKSTWALIEGKYYYFDANGYMKTGWQQLGGKWYYLKSSGEMATGWQRIKGTWYYLKDSGEMAVGWQQVGDEWYYLKSSGAMATGWQNLGGTWYYLKSSGAMATGWAKVGGKWYYLKSNGAMATGWQQVGDEWYYLKSSGAMATGWQRLGGKWYYLKSSGAMAVGWAKVGGKWYYLKESGAMATGWQQVAGEWYYLEPSGAMATGWKLLNNKWYYLKSSGAMATGWVTVNGKQYYLNENGVWVK